MPTKLLVVTGHRAVARERNRIGDDTLIPRPIHVPGISDEAFGNVNHTVEMRSSLISLNDVAISTGGAQGAVLENQDALICAVGSAILCPSELEARYS